MCNLCVQQSILSSFHKTQGFWMVTRMIGLIIESYGYAIRKKCTNNLCGPKVHYIILARNPNISDGCLNKGLFIGPYVYAIKNKQ